MGWSELRSIPNEYNEEVAELDEKLIELMVKRRALTGRRRFGPPAETIAAWSARYDIDESRIRLFLNALQEQAQPVMPDRLGPLLGVIPMMKRTVANHCEYIMTHLMQHENASLVSVEIEYLGEDRHEVQILRPNLMLEVIGGDRPYHVQRHGNRGGGPKTEMQFLVSPPLPAGLERIEFSLVPRGTNVELKQRQIVLDKQVDFD